MNSYREEPMIHRAQDTYPLSHFRQRTGEHLQRLEDGRVETITQNGKAAMVVMSPETYDLMRLEIERGRLWDEEIQRVGEGRGRDAREVLQKVAARAELQL
jgi:prevent-host-death family protein